MPGRTASEAEGNFAYFFRESLSVITNAFLLAHAEKDRKLLLYEPPVKLQRKSGDPLYMSITQTFLITRNQAKEYKASTTGYTYALFAKEADEFHHILEFHWHPETTPKLKWPHLHVIGNTRGGDLARAHLPTGRLCIEDFIRLLVRDFGVKPRMAHDDWKRILTKNKKAFCASASWLYWEQLI